MAIYKRIFAGFVVAAVAAPLMADGLPSDSVRVKWTEDKTLNINMTLDAGGYVPKRNTRVIVTPVLTGEDGNSKTLPAVEFATRRNRRYNDRLAALGGDMRNSVYGSADTVNYCQTVDVEEWMLHTPLTLHLRREKEGCCNIELLSENVVASTRYVVPFTPLAQSVAPQLSVAEKMAAVEPVLVPASEYRPFNPQIPLATYKGALYVHFPMEKSGLDENYRENKATLEKIVALVQGIEADTASQVVKVRIVGLASPEGPVKLNEKLARKRAEELKDYLAARVALPQQCYEVIGAGEAWADLEYTIASSGLEEKEEVLEVLRQTGDPNRREQLLRKMNGGKVFEYLAQQVFVDQRNAGYIQVYYEAAPDDGAAVINRAVKMVDEGDCDGAIELLEKLDDCRKYNTLGVAYFMKGRRQEAEKCFEKGAQCGDRQAEKNLEGMKLR